ncbi:ribonuclease H1 [Penicillium brasilianum]|uniref:ribonuclease H n=1 Tax=Penicillium brasilianum TaxID=104259 RepID=A0A1S9S1G5_PENBI|nr:ribonuclease H1 [Penicillium brasilianum]
MFEQWQRSGAFGDWGIPWRKSHRNVSYTLDSYGRHTNQTAELHACLSALFDALVIQREWEVAGDRLSAIVIKSDSEYVVRGLTEWLPKWKKNGWKNARGSPVVNSAYFQQIEQLIEILELDISVKFWAVPRERNGMADSLAKSALVEKAEEPDKEIEDQCRDSKRLRSI